VQAEQLAGTVRTETGHSKFGSVAVEDITKLERRGSSPLTVIGYAIVGGAVIVGAVLLVWVPEVDDQLNQ
jgi:hypothetical protein